MRPKVVFYGFYFNDLDTANRFYRQHWTWIPVSRYLRQYSVLFNLVRESRVSAAPQYEPIVSADDRAEQIRRTLERQNLNFEQRWQMTVKEMERGVADEPGS